MQTVLPFTFFETLPLPTYLPISRYCTYSAVSGRRRYVQPRTPSRRKPAQQRPAGATLGPDTLVNWVRD